MSRDSGVIDAPVISAIIVSYNTREMTLECLASLMADVGDVPTEIFLIDNASTDGTVAAIRERFPHVTLIQNSQNKGFGAANNQAMKPARGKYFLLLNSDAFPKAGAIPALLDCIEKNPKAAVVGPKLLNVDGSVQQSCFPFPSPGYAWRENLWLTGLSYNYRGWAHDSQRVVDWVIGACMLVRREVFDQLGGFDESFFMYAEESDWQKRIRDAGWQVVFTPTAEVIHKGGASGAADKARINRHFFESLDTYTLKHHGYVGLITLRLAMAIGCFMRAMLWIPVAIAATLAPAAAQRRAVAVSKVRLHSWLVFRQLTHWRISLGQH